MILIDTNALVVLIVGYVDPRRFKDHKRVSIYDEEDFYKLESKIGGIKNLVVLPNVWTETDNLLNDFTGVHKNTYLEVLETITKASTEVFIPSEKAIKLDSIYDLGITDSLLLEHGKSCDLLITGDSGLSDYALAYGIEVYDTVKIVNARITQLRRKHK